MGRIREVTRHGGTGGVVPLHPQEAPRGPLPLIHLIVPMEVGDAESVTQRPPKTAELSITRFTSSRQEKLFLSELHETLMQLAARGFEKAVLRVDKRDMPTSAWGMLKYEFDTRSTVSKQDGAYTRYSIDLTKAGYLKALASGEYPRTRELYKKVTRGEFARVLDVFKGNLQGIEKFLEVQPNPEQIRDVEKTGGDGNPYGMVKTGMCAPSENCICFGDDRKPHMVTLSEGYHLRGQRIISGIEPEFDSKSGSGLAHILARRSETIRRLFGGGKAGETPVDRFLNQLFNVSYDPELILPAGGLRFYVGQIDSPGPEKRFLKVVAVATHPKQRYIVTAYPQDEHELRDGLVKTLSEVYIGNRITYLAGVNRYLGWKGIKAIQREECGIQG